jgi:hypothetical protein
MISQKENGTSRALVVDVDGSIVKQSKTLEKYSPTVVPAQDMHDTLRYWCSKEELDQLGSRVKEHTRPFWAKLSFTAQAIFTI